MIEIKLYFGSPFAAIHRNYLTFPPYQGARHDSNALVFIKIHLRRLEDLPKTQKAPHKFKIRTRLPRR